MEGNAQFIIWITIVNNLNFVSKSLELFFSSVSPSQPSLFNSSAEYVNSLNQTLSDINYRFTNELTDFSSNLTTISEYNINSTQGRSEILRIMNDLVLQVWVFVIDNFGVNIIEDAEELTVRDFRAVISVFSTVVIYFFIGSGAYLILLGVLYWFGEGKISKHELYSVVVRVIGGTGLAMSTLVYLNDDAFTGLLVSAWIIPIVVLIFAIG